MLSDLLDQRPARDVAIAGLCLDSRKVGPGDLFAALPGAKQDGRAFIAQALDRGAAAILAPEDTRIDESRAVLVADAEPRRLLARIAARFFARQPAVMAAVTGTNGKSSVADFTRQIWEKLGHRSASLGTLGLVAPGRIETGSLTTPDPIALHRTLAELADAGVDHAVFEASSHGLDQFRLDGTRIQIAAFTNLTRDHLDYHGDITAYRTAKQRLFLDILPAGGTAVINADSDEAAALMALCAARGQTVVSYGLKGQDIRIDAATPEAQGQDIALTVRGTPYHLHLPLAGAFQASNAACALGIVLASGADEQIAVQSLAGLHGVRGRLEKIGARANGATVYVDYAHTPDALATVLAALRPHVRGRLAVLFGCGGDRDPGKRPMMGEIAARLADRVIVTDDNPRSESPASIRKAILAACPGAREIGSRRDAIRTAVAELDAGDVLLLAGKGHERGQIVGGTVLPFDDADEARRALEECP